MVDDLKNRAVTGVTWLVFAQISGEILRFVVAVILARILTPDEFGLIGMVLVFSGFAKLFNDMGFSAALVQKLDVQQIHYSSVFWLSILAGFFMMALLFLAAPLLAWFFDEPKLIPLAQVISLEFLLGSLVIVQRARFTRNMDFRVLAIVQVVAAAVAGALGIAMALAGFGVYALAAQLLATTTCLSGLVWYLSDWRPRLSFSWSAIREMLGFSAGVAGGSMLNYWIRNADNLLIGKVLGSAQLGLYTRAYTIMLLPLTQISSVLSRVMFPAMSAIQDDKPRAKRIYLRAISAIALFSFPAMLSLLVVADDFVLVIFGPKWEEMIPVLRVLCVVGLLQSVNSTVGWIYQSQGRSDIQFWWILATGLLSFLAFAIGVFWGILGVAIAYAIRVLSTTWLNYSIPGRLIDMTVSEVARELYQPLLLSVAVASLLAVLRLILPETLSHPLRLVLLVAIGILAFIISTKVMNLRVYTDLMRLFREKSAHIGRRVSHSN